MVLSGVMEVLVLLLKANRSIGNKCPRVLVRLFSARVKSLVMLSLLNVGL